MEIPIALRRYFADSWLSVAEYKAEHRTLAVEIEKDIGPEKGIIRFVEVRFLSLPTSFNGEDIRAYPLAAAPGDFWMRGASRDCLDGDETVFELLDQDVSQSHFVAAKSIEYEILSDRS